MFNGRKHNIVSVGHSAAPNSALMDNFHRAASLTIEITKGIDVGKKIKVWKCILPSINISYPAAAAAIWLYITILTSLIHHMCSISLRELFRNVFLCENRVRVYGIWWDMLSLEYRFWQLHYCAAVQCSGVKHGLILS